MSSLEEIRPGARVKGIAPGGTVEVVSAEWIGTQAVNVVFRDPSGAVSETTLFREDEARVQLEQAGRAWSFDADGALTRLVRDCQIFCALTSFVRPLESGLRT